MKKQKGAGGNPRRAGRSAQIETDPPWMVENNRATQLLMGIALHGKENEKLSGQIAAFLKLCDDDELMVLFDKKPTIEMMRLAFIARIIHFTEFSLLIIANISSKELKELNFSSNNTLLETRALQNKWLRDFYEKQPEGKQKKKLSARIVMNY